MRRALFVLLGGLVLLGCQGEEEGEGEAQLPRFALANQMDGVLLALPDSASLQRVGALGQAMTRFELVGDTLFWAYDNNNLFGAYDVSDPSSPALLFSDSVPVPENVDYSLFRVRVFGDLLVACCSERGLAFYTLSGGPQLVAYFDSLPARDCYKEGNYLYVVSGKLGRELYVLDISDPANPSLVGIADSAFNADHLLKLGNYLYTSGWIDGRKLCLYDVSDPTNPRFVESVLPNAEEVNGLFLRGNLLYAVGDALYILDVSDPANPQLLGSHKEDDYLGMTSSLNELYVAGSYAYVAATLSSSGNVIVFDVSDSTNPKELGRFDFGGLGGYDIAPLP